MVRWLRLKAPGAGSPCPIPGQGTKARVLQLNIQYSQIKSNRKQQAALGRDVKLLKTEDDLSSAPAVAFKVRRPAAAVHPRSGAELGHLREKSITNHEVCVWGNHPSNVTAGQRCFQATRRPQHVCHAWACGAVCRTRKEMGLERESPHQRWAGGSWRFRGMASTRPVSSWAGCRVPCCPGSSLEL